MNTLGIVVASIAGGFIGFEIARYTYMFITKIRYSKQYAQEHIEEVIQKTKEEKAREKLYVVNFEEVVND